ncbi:Endophilin-A3 [Podochytrium sp. JEL0797]|nr:Endophilin-A3 [Podochytrium sp. JEL0797]
MDSTAKALFREHLVQTTMLQVDDSQQHFAIAQALLGPTPRQSQAPSLAAKRSTLLGGTNNTATHSIVTPVRVAVKDFQSGVDGDLAFRLGDLIEVIAEVDENWMTGSINGRSGIFPTNFTEPKTVFKPLPKSNSAPSNSPSFARPVLPNSPKPITASIIAAGPPPPPPLASKPFNKPAISNRPSMAHSISSTMSLTPQPQPHLMNQQPFFYMRSKANGNVLGVEMGLTNMVTHDSPILVVSLTTKNTEPLLLRQDETGCLITPSNLAVDVRVGEWMNGGTVVLAKRVAHSSEERLHQRWEIAADGAVKSERGFMLVEDYGRAVVWECAVDLEDQRWDLVPLSS